MMEKEKIQIEYIFDKVSKNSLWNYLATASGLSEWFADNVTVDEELFIFTWNKSSSEAKQIGILPYSYVRFKWLEEENTDTYFEFKLHIIELTGGIMLEVTDFSDPHEKTENISLWDSQIKILKRTLGI